MLFFQDFHSGWATSWYNFDFVINLVWHTSFGKRKKKNPWKELKVSQFWFLIGWLGRFLHALVSVKQSRTLKVKLGICILGLSWNSVSFIYFSMLSHPSSSSPRCSSCAVLTCACIGPLTPVPSGPVRSKTKRLSFAQIKEITPTWIWGGAQKLHTDSKRSSGAREAAMARWCSG